MRLRRAYYDFFSRWYDRVIALHSGDASARARDFLIERSCVGAGGRLLDICTGTGAVALRAQRAVGASGLVVGLDFSVGMIRKALEKARQAEVAGLWLVVGDAARLPFAAESFDAVTCSHAIYELSPEVRERALREVQRVLCPGGQFLMMEHREPSHPIVRFLYGVRLATMGSSRNREFARDETPFLRRYFVDVTTEISPSARSKLVRGVKDGRTAHG